MISIIHSPNSGFYVFDSHARNPLGMPDMNGKAVLLSLRNIFSLENYLQLLATAVNATFFEVVSVTFHNLNCSQSQEFALTINPRKRKHPTQNYYERKLAFTRKVPNYEARQTNFDVLNCHIEVGSLPVPRFCTGAN